MPFADHNAFETHKRQIIAEASSQTVTPPPSQQVDHPATSENSDCIWQFFDQQVQASSLRQLPNVTSLTKVDQYLKLPLITRKEDPLVWWKQNGHLFSALSLVAQKHLTGIATSVPSERLFSKAGEVISEKRNRIKPKNVDMLLFLNKYQ